MNIPDTCAVYSCTNSAGIAVDVSLLSVSIFQLSKPTKTGIVGGSRQSERLERQEPFTSVWAPFYLWQDLFQLLELEGIGVSYIPRYSHGHCLYKKKVRSRSCNHK